MIKVRFAYDLEEGNGGGVMEIYGIANHDSSGCEEEQQDDDDDVHLAFRLVAELVDDHRARFVPACNLY